MTNNTSKGWLIGLEKKKTRMLALILALIVVFTNTDLTVLADGPEDNPGYNGTSSSEDRFEENSEEDDDEDEESLDTEETEEENDGDDGDKNSNEEETAEEDEGTKDTEDTLEPEEIEEAELIEEEEILAATGDEPEVQYTLIVNTSTDSISLDPGESCNIPYGESVSFSAKVTTTGEETQVETFNSGVSVIYATSVSGLESYTAWPGTPDVGDYYVSYYIQEKEIAPDTSEVYFRLSVVDEEDPVITSYSISGENIAFSAKDTQSGLSAYAISTASSASGVSGWTSVTGAPLKDDAGISETATFDTMEPGNYYLYAKDASGNVARSDEYISVSVLNVHDYYVNNAATQYSVHVATPEGEDATALLPSAAPTRTKFDFGGFYPSEEFTGDGAAAGAAVSINAGEENDYYAKWTLKGVVFANDLSATYSKTYDGEDLELSVSLTESYDTVSWTWYRAAAADGNYAAVTGGADGTLTLKNVSESGFYKAVASITEEGVSSTADSSVAQVTISKRPLYINVDNKETVYGSDAPSFTMTAAEPDGASGLVSGDSLESVFGAGYASNLSCDYANDGGANSVVGTYNITAGSLSADNYDVTFTSGTLTVTTLSVDSNVTVEVSVEDGPFTYTGSAIEPVVTAVDITYTPAGAGASVTKTLSAEDYDVSYANNVNVGSQAQVIITFKGNYQGQYSGKTFEIGKGTMAVQTSISSDSWKYGETPAGISVSIDNTTGGTVSYKYLPVGEEENFAAADKSGAVTTMPKDAGRYYVWAEVAETANYSAITAEPAIFEIRKRQIILTSTSKSWTYDGNPHTAGNYVQTGDAFIEGEGFHSVMVSGSVKTVSESPVVNDITYTLTSSTKAVNYEITLEKGSLSVTQARLPKITSLKWGTTPGTLQWVAITRDGLNIQYEVQLYRGEEPLGEPIITSNTSVDVKELLINDSIANGVGAYTATVTAKIGEDAAGMYNNYMEGTASEKLSYKYTAKITLVRNGGDEGIESLAFADAVHGTDEDDTVTYLLQKESARAVITYNSGYENDDAGTVFNYNTGSTGLSRGDYTKSGYYTVSFANTQLDSAVDANLAIKSKDSAPYCEEFTGSQASDYSYVRADIRIGDLLGLYGYKLVNSIDNITDDNWTEISFVEGRPALSCITSVQLTAAGSYYLVFKDISGNIRYCETPITVYEISFDKNDDAATGTMPIIYKLKDNAVTLPANAFTKAGYVFTYWTAGSAILPDGASYVKNESATLKAGWTNKKFTYKVNYYYQKILLNNDGTVMTDDGGQVMLSYGDEPENYAVYSCAYNDEVSYNAAAIQLEREGYRLTSLPSLPEGSASYVSSIRVTEDGMELDIYYNLEMYTMTYSYTDYDNTSKTMVDYFYYGQPFVERTKPAHTGYSFIGWNYGDAGRAPEFMPAGSLTATGHFKADTASYTIRYYFQNIDTENGAGNYLGTSFVMDGSIQADEVISADYGRQINAYLSSDETSTSKEIVTAREIPGFTPVAVVVSYESSEAKSFASLAELNAFAETTSNDSDLTHNVYSKIEGGAPEGVQDGPTYVSFYYTRKVYELSMDVYRGNRDDGQHLFGSYFDEDQAKWNFPYGYAFPATGTFSAEYFETYKYNDEGTITYDNGREHSVAWTKRWPTGVGVVTADKYYLANFVDWSTGSRPATMPAGDVKVVREYASREQSKYVIEVYVEHVKEVTHTYGGNTYKSYDAGFYEKETSFESYVEPGRIISIVDSGEGSEVEIPISKLIEGVDSKAHFEHVPVEGEVLSAVVLENRYTEDNISILPDSVTTLKLYMSRKKYDVNIRYLKRVYDVDAGTSSDEVITSYKINQKWGTSYNIDSEYYYQGETESVPVGDNEDNAKAKAYLGTVTDSAAVTGAMDFAAADYKIANYWYYVSPSSNSILGYVGGHADYTAYEDAAGAEADRFKAIRVGVNNSSKAEIYYLQPASSKHYYLKLTYRQYVNGVQTTDSAPLTSEVDGVTYQICVANKSDVFESSDNGAALRPEFEEVNVTYYKTATELGQSQSNPGISGTFYRLIDDPHSQKLLFTVVDDDRFHVGGLAGYNYNSTVAAHIGRETFESEENAPDPNLGTPVLVARGDERIGARGSENPILGVNNDTEDYCYNQMSYYFNFNKDFSITYVYDGKTRRIDYGQITDVTADEIGFDRDGANVFEPGEGYEIVWYTDSNFTHVADATIKVNGPKYIYGKRFNKPIENFDIAYYEMPNGAGYYSGSLDSASLTSETEDIEIEYRFDENTVVNKAGTNTKYYLNGTLVAVKKSHFVKAFSEFSMDYASFVTSGFKHDEKNTSNVLSGFCGSRSIKLRSYYARTSALLTIRRNDSDTVSNDEIITKVNGDLVRVYDPVKIGYDFTGWKFYDYTGSVKGSELDPTEYNYVYNPVDQHHQGYSEFDMPICDTLMEAQWTPAVIEFDIVHLFQDRAKTYRQDLLDSCIAGSTPANVVTNVVSGVTYYYENSVSPNNLFGAVEELSGVRSEDVIAVSDHNLSAAGSMVSFANGTYQHNAADSGELVSGDTFRAYHNASVTFFYERNSTITISTGAYCMDGSDDTGLTVSGAGNYYYGQQVNLYATMQPTGYTFQGWFKVNSGEALTTEQIEHLADLVAAEGTDGAVLTKVYNDTEYSFTATESGRYIAITSAVEAIQPTITITISRDLVNDPLYYNYKADAENQFNASINWGQGVDAGANNIKQYTWFYYSPDNMTAEQFEELDPETIPIAEMTPLENSNTSTFNLPTGYNAGFYVLRCVADIERKDNGRTQRAQGSYKFSVLPNNEYLETTPVVNQSYTGNTYRYTEKWLYRPTDYTVYYSESPFTLGEDPTARLALSEGDADKAFTQMPGYRDVIVDASHSPVPHVVYYYVVSNDPNYSSVTGNCSVGLLPVPVTVTAIKPFTKIYDATVEIQGKPSVGNEGAVTYKYSEADGTYSDFYRLQSGIESAGMTPSPYYRINGILSADAGKVMLLNFDATFDYMHAGGSGVQEGTLVTLSNLWVLTSNDSTALHDVYENWNYVFPTGETLQISGQIKPYPLDIKWLPSSESDASATYSDQDFVYNYTGSTISPYIKIVGDTEKIPDATGDFSVSVKNKQVNAGTYSAIPEVEAKDGAGYFPTDYTFTLHNQTYKILPRYIKVYPKDVTKVYNATLQTMLDTEDEFRFETKESAGDTYTAYTLPEGEHYNAKTSASYKNAGVYSTIAAKNMAVYTLDANNKKHVITDNYVIEYGTGTLTIERCPVVINGITGVNKEYDGTALADLDITAANIRLSSDGVSPVYAGDVLTLEKLGKPGDFDTKFVGISKTVTINYAVENTDTRGVGIKATGAYANYVIDTANSQHTTTADIVKDGKVNVHITGGDSTITYGESLHATHFSYEVVGLVEGDSVSADLTVDEDNYPQFMIMKKVGGSYVNAVVTDHAFKQTDDLSFISTLDVGTYYVFFVEKTGPENDGHHFVEGFDSPKYNVCWDYENPATITVIPRKIAVSGIDSAASITKVYDGELSVSGTDLSTILGAADSHDYYEFTAVPGESASGVMTADASSLVISSADAVYNNKNVAVTEGGVTVGATKVNLTECVLGGSAASNYELVNSTFDVPGAITPRDITVKINNQTVTYGSAPAAYNYTVEGAVEADEETIIAGLKNTTLTAVDCDYQAVATPAAGKSHDAGYYAMNVNGTTHYTNPNYTMTFPVANGLVGETFGLLTVNKKNLRYRAKDVHISYGVQNPPTIFDGEFVSSDFVYGDTASTQKNENEKAKIISGTSGTDIALYTDSALSTSAGTYEVEFESTANASSLPGTYPVSPVNVATADGYLYTKNYNITASSGNLIIKKYYILVEGITVADKVYDGTTTVTTDGEGNQIDLTTATFKYYVGATSHVETYAQLPENFKASFDTADFTAVYADKNVGTNINVSLGIVIKDGSDLAKRYMLLTSENKAEATLYDSENIFGSDVSQTSALSSITAKELVLKPKNISCNYAQSVAASSIVVEGTGFVSGESLANIPGYVKKYTLTSESDPTANYVAGADVGRYVIDISSSEPGAGIHGNYNISFDTGILTVNQRTFPAPTNITWNAGRLSWNAVTAIGHVAVAGYKLQLYKVGAGNTVTTIDCNPTTNYDFTEVIRNAGAGTYYVRIWAVASTENNTSPDYKNVKQYGDLTNSANKMAVLVVPKYSDDAVTAKATDALANKNVYPVTGSLLDYPDGYVVVAGEAAGVNVLYSWKSIGTDGEEYATGYEIDSFSASSDTGVTLVTTNDLSASGSFAGSALIADGIEVTSVDLILKLKKRAAQGSLTISGTSDSAPYGALVHTPYEANVSHTANVGYTYTYEWSYKLGHLDYSSSSTPVPYDVVRVLNNGVVETQNNPIIWDQQTFTFPRGKRAQTYNVLCKVVAKRKDNGETVTLNANKAFTITKPTAGDPDSLVLEVSDWNYGESRIPAECTPLFGDEMGTITIEYRKKGQGSSAWNTAVPTEAGTYEARARSAGTESYPAVTSHTKEFNIYKVTLLAPENFAMHEDGSGMAYGLLKWNAVTGFSENAGVSPASVVTVTYEVKTYYQAVSGTTYGQESLVKTDVVSATQLNVLDYIDRDGRYVFKIRALANERTNAGNNNCNDSETVVLGTPIFGASITTDAQGNSKEYDGEPVTITAGYEDGSDSYVFTWYRNGEVITGADERSYSFVEVNDSGLYSVAVTTPKLPDPVFSVTINVSVTKRPVKITGFDDEKTYDNTALTHAGTYSGAALTAQMYDLVYTGNVDPERRALVDGAALTELTFAGTIRDAGSESNTPSGAKIVNAAGDKTSNYAITYTPGTLTVNKKAANITAPNDTKVYDGTALTAPGFGAGVAANKKITTTGLLTDHEVSAVLMTAESTITEAGSTSNVVDLSSVTIVDTAEGNRDVTANYDLSKTDGTLTVTKASSYIDAAGGEYTYDGTAKGITASMRATNTEEVFGNAALRYALVTTDENGGEVVGNSSLALTFIHAGVYKIRVSLAESDNHQAAAPVDVILTINTRNLSIEAVTKSKEYDAGPHTVADTEYSIAAGTLADGDSIRSIDVYNAGEATRVGETESSKAKDIVIKNSANADVTSDYAVTYIDGELTFTKRSITVTAKDHNKTYDGTALTAGVPSIVMSLSDSNNNYYTVGTPGLATGDKVFSITISGSQLTNGSSDATPQAARIVHAGVDVTGCYDITYVAGTLSVQKRNITLTAKNHSKVYDGTPLSYSGTYNADESLYTIGGQGLGEGDEVISFTLTGSITDTGEAPLVPSDLLIKAGDENRTGNYNITYVNGKVKVTNAGLTVTAKEINKEYDKTPLTYSDKSLSEKLAAVTLTGLNAGDEVTAITLTGSITNAGERALVPSAVTISRGGEDVTESYTINYVNGKLIIDKRPITVTAANASGMYGTKPSTLTYAITGGSEVTSGDAGISLTCSARATSDVGDYDITPVISSANYVLTPVVGTYMVTARPIIIQAKDATEKYVPGINLQKNGYEIASGSLASGDAIESVTVTGNLDTVGSAANVASDAVIKKGSKDVTGNYQISYADGILTVDKGIQQIIASDKSVEYNGQSHDASEIERKLKYEDDVTIAVENPDDSILTAGEMEVTFKTAETALFMAATKTVKLTVTKRAITITADSAKKTYDGQPLTKESYKVTKGSLAEGDVITEDSLTVRADNEEGSITKPGKVVNKISGDAVIMHDNTDVSGSYEITYKDGKLVVKKKEVKSGSDDGSDTKESTVDPGSVSPKKGEKDPSDNNEEDSTSDPGKQPGKKETDPEESGSDSGGSDSDNGHSSGSETGNKDNEPGDESAEDKGLVKYIVGTKSDEELEPSDGSRKEDIVDCEVVDADIERMIEELLTLDEKVRVEKYNPLRFRVEVKKDELVRTDDVENSIREKLPENYRIVGTFDARFFVKIGDEAEKLIGKNYSSVKTSFMIPEEMWDDAMVGKSQILRTYRDDKGRLVTEVILAEVEGQSVVMDVDNFSSYTLVTEAMVVTDVHHCYIHWLILLLFLIAVLDIVVFYRIGKDDEKEGKKDKKPARIRHYVILIGLNGLGIVLVFFGSCSWDLFMAVISVLATAALEMLERRRREKNRKKHAA